MSGKLQKPKVAEIIVKVSTFFWIYLATGEPTRVLPNLFSFFNFSAALEIERTFQSFPAHLGPEAMAKLCRNKSLNWQFPWPLARYHHQKYLSKYWNVFVQIFKSICPTINLYFTNIEILFYNIFNRQFPWPLALYHHQIYLSKYDTILKYLNT